MANRTIYEGDTFPDALFQLSDETGVLDLSSATAIEAEWEGKAFEFDGTCVAITPPIDDPDGTHHWNCRYVFASGDSAAADGYTPFIRVTWTTGKIQTFATTDELSVKALPAPA